MPLVVKYGISNLIDIGGFLSGSSFVKLVILDYENYIPAFTDGSPKCARSTYSFPPGNDLIFHRIEFFSGTYVTVPTLTLNFGVSASSGTGI